MRINDVTDPPDALAEEIGKLLVALGLLVQMPLQFLAEAAIVMLLWGWFVVPLGVPDVGYWHALGLSLLWAWFSFSPGNIQMTPDGLSAQWQRIKYWWFGAAMMLACAGAVKLLAF